MADAALHEALIARLARELRPVRRIPSPGLMAVVWVGAAALLAVPLSFLSDLHALVLRLTSQPDMWVSHLGALLTAIFGAYAAFLTSVPGRSRMAPLLVVPPAVMWISASTVGCLRLTPLLGTVPEPAMHPVVCLNFLLLVSVPLAALITLLLARAYPLRPGLTAVLAGLACAGAASCLLQFIHPFDATAEDLLVHLGAVLAVIGVMRWVAPRWLDRSGRGG